MNPIALHAIGFQIIGKSARFGEKTVPLAPYLVAWGIRDRIKRFEPIVCCEGQTKPG